MKNAHVNSKAAVGPVFGSVLVRRLLACVLIGCAAMSAAHAGPGGRGPQSRQDYSRDADQRQQQPRQYDDRQQRQFDERAFQARAEADRREIEQPQQSNEGRRNGGRMTPDERRDLRRQITEAGADLYPNHGRRREPRRAPQAPVFTSICVLRAASWRASLTIVNFSRLSIHLTTASCYAT